MPAALSRYPALVLTAALVARAQPAELPPTALVLLNAYLAQAALSDPADRADARVGDPPDVSSGRLAGYSSLLGSFSYRPKTYADLDRTERTALLRDPAWHAFLAAANRRNPGRAEPPSPRTATGGAARFTVSPEEMLAAVPVRVDLSRP